MHAASLSEQAAQAWSQRAQPGETERAFVLWEKALVENPQDKQTLIDLTRAAGRAYRHANTAAQRRTWSERGRSYAQRAVEKNPNSSDAWTEYGAALGQWADSHRGLQALKVVQRAVAALHKAIALKKENAFAHMLLSQFYGKSPKLFSVGNKAKALEEAMLAVHYDPNLSIARLALGHRFLESGKKAEAIREFQSVLAVTPAADRIPETQSDQETARELLKSLGAPQTPEPLGQACTDSSQCSGACVADPGPVTGGSAGHCEAPPLSFEGHR